MRMLFYEPNDFCRSIKDETTTSGFYITELINPSNIVEHYRKEHYPIS